MLEGLLLTPALVPPMTFAMGLHFLFIKFSLAESMAGVIIVLAMFSYPYMFRALVAGFQTMGRIIGYAPETWVPEASRSCCGWNCPCSSRR